MTAPVVPRLYIEAPAVEPYKYGLFGAAVDDTPADEHWQAGGVEWESLASYPTMQYAAGLFAPHGSNAAQKSLPSHLPTSKAYPLAVYAGVDCASIGWTQEEAEQRAADILDMGGQHAAELALWTGGAQANGATGAVALNGFTTNPTTGAPTATPAATTLTAGAVAPEVAVGLLEKWIANNYNGRAMLHTTRDIAAGLDKARQVHRDDADTLRTTLGSRWVFGGGYDGTGPGQTAKPAGSSWIYVTGAVIVMRSTSIQPASFEASLNRTTNNEFLIREQVYLLGIDGPWAAAQVTAPA